jgi:hypothetical protein
MELKRKYNKEAIENEAIISAEQGEITNGLGKFILQRSEEISHFAFITNGDEELRQSLIDEAVMRVCVKFLDYYKPNKSAANLIISMIYSTMTNKIVSLKWRDVYGQRIKGKVLVVENGEAKYKLIRYIKDEQISKKL